LMIKTKVLIFFSFIFLFAAFIQAQKEGDRIIAIVGNDIILESDLNTQLLLYARQNNITQFNDVIIQQVFQNMLAEKLMLAKADQDSIVVTDEEVQKQVEYRLSQLTEQFGSEKNLEQAYGITMMKIKSILREDLRRKMKVDK